jgi:hypothetical protein
VATTKATEDTVSAIVAHGRTVVTPHPTEMVDYYRPDDEGKMVRVRAPLQVHNPPGKKISLPRSDFDNLRALGYVIDASDEAAVNGLRAAGHMIH